MTFIIANFIKINANFLHIIRFNYAMHIKPDNKHN